MPPAVQDAVVRRQFRVDENPDLRTSVAASKADLLASYRLLHDAYVKAGLMYPHPTGMRVTFHMLLPFCTTLVAKVGTTVVGTVSLISDSEFGLPSDSSYKSENHKLRARGLRLVEVSALSCHPEWRGGAASMYLMRFLAAMMRTRLKCDALVVTVRRRTEMFYRPLLGFERSGDIIDYQMVNGTRAVFMYLEVAKFPDVAGRYPTSAPLRNLAMFTSVDESPEMTLPDARYGQTLFPTAHPDVVRDIMGVTSPFNSGFTDEQVKILQTIYAPIVDFGDTDVIRLPSGKTLRYRFDIPATVETNDVATVARIVELSSRSGQILTAAPLPRTRATVSFRFGQRDLTIPVMVEKARPAANGMTRTDLTFTSTNIEVQRAIVERIYAKIIVRTIAHTGF